MKHLRGNIQIESTSRYSAPALSLPSTYCIELLYCSLCTCTLPISSSHLQTCSFFGAQENLFVPGFKFHIILLSVMICPRFHHISSVSGGKTVCNLTASRQRSRSIPNPAIPTKPSAISVFNPGLPGDITRGSRSHIACRIETSR